MPEKFVNIEMDDAAAETDNTINGVSAVISGDGKTAKIQFSYAKDPNYAYCFIYVLNEEDFQKGNLLNTFLDKQKIETIIDRKMPQTYRVPLENQGKRVVLFAARREKNVYYLVNQCAGNVTESLRIRPTIRCHVKYEEIKKNFFFTDSGRRKAVILIDGDFPVPGAYIVYSCVGAERKNKKFGIDISRFFRKRLEIIIKKSEKIQIFPSDKNSYILQTNIERG